MQINNKKCADSEYWKEKLDLNTILGVFKDIRFFFHKKWESAFYGLKRENNEKLTMTHLLKNVRISIRKPSKQTASKSDHFEFFTYVYRRKKTQKSKFEKKKNANKSQKMC